MIIDKLFWYCQSHLEPIHELHGKGWTKRAPLTKAPQSVRQTCPCTTATCPCTLIWFSLCCRFKSTPYQQPSGQQATRWNKIGDGRWNLKNKNYELHGTTRYGSTTGRYIILYIILIHVLNTEYSIHNPLCNIYYYRVYISNINSIFII